MKECPQCHSSCEDDDSVCKNCGYLFPPKGYYDTSESQNDNGPDKAPYGGPDVPLRDNPGPEAPGEGFYGRPGGPTQQGTYNGGPYGPTPGPYGYNQLKRNGMSVASLVLGIIGVVFSCWTVGIIPGIISLILGIVAKRRIRRSQGTQSGDGMALAGIILGIIAIILGIYVIITLILNRGELIRFMQSYMNNYPGGLNGAGQSGGSAA